MTFHVIASTGRTATTFLARALDSFEGVAACHEGYLAADKDETPLLPLINLENRQAYLSAEAATKVVGTKRSEAVVAEKMAQIGCDTLVDVAYYNPTIAAALLAEHPQMRMVAIIRELEPFVRSATAMSGEDLLPVGWADPAKELSPRERFIEMGRIRPAKGTEEDAAWNGWSAIQRNIWLWRETNALLLAAREEFGERVLVIPFEDLKAGPEEFLGRIAAHFGLDGSTIPQALENAQEHKNRKASGYQVGPMSEWTEDERDFAQQAQEVIGSKL